MLVFVSFIKYTKDWGTITQESYTGHIVPIAHGRMALDLSLVTRLCRTVHQDLLRRIHKSNGL